MERLKAEDKWILSKLQKTVESINDALSSYRFNEACHTLYDFTWHEFCDWYIEAKRETSIRMKIRKGAQMLLRCHLLCLLPF